MTATGGLPDVIDDSDGPARRGGLAGRHPGKQALTLAVATTILTNLPVFLLGALIAEMSVGISIPAAALGLAVGTYWIFSAFASISVSSLGRHTNTQTIAVLAVLFAAVSLLGLALVMPVWEWMLLWAAIGGIGNGFGHPASNDLIIARVAVRNRALSFGIKQAAVPLAGLVAGVSLPLIAITVGWQIAFILGAIYGVLLTALYVVEARITSLTRPPKAPHVPMSREVRKYLFMMAGVTTLAATAVNATSVFAVTGALQRGFDPSFAGILLGVGSLLAAITRIILGAAADRGIGGTVSSVRWILLVAMVGLFAMAIPTTWTYVVGFLLAVGIGWGWPGVTHFIVSRVSGKSTAAGTGIVQTGSYIGSALGPAILGVSFQLWGGVIPWIILGVIALAGAVMASITARLPAPA
jgi:cyanate permease